MTIKWEAHAGPWTRAQARSRTRAGAGQEASCMVESPLGQGTLVDAVGAGKDAPGPSRLALATEPSPCAPCVGRNARARRGGLGSSSTTWLCCPLTSERLNRVKTGRPPGRVEAKADAHCPGTADRHGERVGPDQDPPPGDRRDAVRAEQPEPESTA